MTTGDLGGLLELYADLSRLETDVTQLVETLAALADDELLRASEHLREDREGIVRLAQTLAQVEVEAVGARAAVTEAIEQRRSDLPDVEAFLTLYRDVTRAEQDVTELDLTVTRTSVNPTLQTVPELAHLAEVLQGVRERLDRDGGIMLEVEYRIRRLLAGD